MKGLLWKDFYMIKEYCKPYLVISMTFLVTGAIGTANAFMIVFPAVLAGMIPTVLLSVEEKCRWNLYGDVLPDSRFRAVSEKYLLAVIWDICILAGTAAAQGLGMVWGGRFDWGRYAVLLSMTASTGLLSAALMLPFLFKFGAEKGKSGYLAVFSLAVAGWTVVSVMQIFHPNHEIALFSAGWRGALVSVLGSIAVFVASWRLSLQIYRKREL